jgi:hypothetical protein
MKKEIRTTKKCQHPAHRLHAWTARDDSAKAGEVLCVACCDCGKVLK